MTPEEFAAIKSRHYSVSGLDIHALCEEIERLQSKDAEWREQVEAWRQKGYLRHDFSCIVETRTREPGHGPLCCSCGFLEALAPFEQSADMGVCPDCGGSGRTRKRNSFGHAVAYQAGHGPLCGKCGGKGKVRKRMVDCHCVDDGSVGKHCITCEAEPCETCGGNGVNCPSCKRED